MFSFNPFKWFTKKPAPVELKVEPSLKKPPARTVPGAWQAVPPVRRPDVRPIGAGPRTDDDDLVWLQPPVSSLYSGMVAHTSTPTPAPAYSSGGGGSFSGGGASSSYDSSCDSSSSSSDSGSSSSCD